MTNLLPSLISRATKSLSQYLIPQVFFSSKFSTKSAMASSLALKKLVSSSILSRSLRSLRAVAQPASLRLFNSNAVREYEIAERQPDRRAFSPFSDFFSPFSSRSSLSQILNVMDQFMESPISSSFRRNWDAKETDDGLHLRVDMPGPSKEEVKVSVEQSTLIIKGEGKKELDDEETVRRYSSRIDLPDKLYKTDEIKAEMKNGILRIFLPKIKEERTGVFNVNVQ